MNACHFLGRLCNDPVLKQLDNGVDYTNFKIAVRDPHVKGKAAFLSCNAWSDGAKYIAEHFQKGDRILVNCSVRQNDFTDKEGNKRSSLQFRINSFHRVDYRDDPVIEAASE